MSKKTHMQIMHACELASHGPREANRYAVRSFGVACTQLSKRWKEYGETQDADERVLAQEDVDMAYRHRNEAYDVLMAILEDYETIRMRAKQAS